jgi:hypothetical protein
LSDFMINSTWSLCSTILYTISTMLLFLSYTVHEYIFFKMTVFMSIEKQILCR